MSGELWEDLWYQGGYSRELAESWNAFVKHTAPADRERLRTDWVFRSLDQAVSRAHTVNQLREAIETALNYVDFVEVMNKEVAMAKKKEQEDAPVPIEEAVKATVRPELESLCEEYRALCDTVAAAETGKSALMDRIKQIVPPEHRAIQGDGWLLVKKAGSRTDIKAEKLLELGVGMDVIEGATVRKTWEFYNVERPKEKASE